MTTVNHECYVSHEVAKLLEQAGFDWKCKYAYIVTHEGDMPTGEEGMLIEYVEDVNWAVKAPVLEAAQKWLREVKGYLVSSMLCVNRKGKGNSFGFSVCSVSEDLSECRMIYPYNYYDEEDSKDFVKYEDALEAGIKKALEVVLKKGE